MADSVGPKIHASARLGWEWLDVPGTIEEAVTRLQSKHPDDLEMMPMMPTADLREIWGIHRGRRVGFIVAVRDDGTWAAVLGTCLKPG